MPSRRRIISIAVVSAVFVALAFAAANLEGLDRTSADLKYNGYTEVIPHPDDSASANPH